MDDGVGTLGANTFTTDQGDRATLGGGAHEARSHAILETANAEGTTGETVRKEGVDSGNVNAWAKKMQYGRVVAGREVVGGKG